EGAVDLTESEGGQRETAEGNSMLERLQQYQRARCHQPPESPSAVGTVSEGDGCDPCQQSRLEKDRPQMTHNAELREPLQCQRVVGQPAQSPEPDPIAQPMADCGPHESGHPQREKDPPATGWESQPPAERGHDHEGGAQDRSDDSAVQLPGMRG